MSNSGSDPDLITDEPAAASGTPEPVHPSDVLDDWFDDSNEWAGQLAGMLTEAYEGQTIPESFSDDLAAIAVDVDTVQRYLRDCAVDVDG
ncbi:hypothetical protein BWI15_00315 [Kribbella sp. ALI-6-A]|nr:hypothetical protein BWI15_00315 [Kribbella sp. ALI-6-A]